ncbi:MAG: hypothetical protein HY885_08170 [Deltaproteobacteria bacterium]|nr:hypothetical protein [Deltaproteobacteria bacterium]
MLKIILSIAMVLSLLFLVKESIISLRTDITPEPPASEEKQAKTQQSAQQPEKTVAFYPTVPNPLPDLSKGYVFNEERHLEGAAGPESEDDAEENSTGPSVDMETVFYAGSIIVGDMRKGLITFPPPPAAAPPASEKKTGKDKDKQAAAQPKARGYAQLAVGDSFSGYTVSAVEADRIVFQKGSDTVEKMLNDPKKARIAPPPPPPPKEKVKAAPEEKAPPDGKAPTASTAKTKRVQLDKAKPGTPGQPAKTRGATRTVPNPKIQVPGVPQKN